MQAYTYEQLPASAQGIARTHMAPHERVNQQDFARYVANGLRQRGFPSRNAPYTPVLLHHETLTKLAGMPMSIIETHRALEEEGYWFTLEETVDGHVIVRSDCTDNEMAANAGVEQRQIAALRRITSQFIEQAMPEARRYFTDKYIALNGMPPLFTARGEKITYDLYE